MSDIIIIGAGPAGLAMAGRLRKQGISFDLVEQATQVANSWRQHYDRLKLHTVKQYSHLPHLPFPEEYPKFVSKDQLVAYLENYTEQFDLSPQLGVTVEKISRKDDQWEVKTNQDTQLYQKVIVATGVNRVPKVPKFKHEDQYQGEVLHSRAYKNPAPFMNKKVLVVGMGNTGAEIALDLSNSNVHTSISVRSKINIVPLVFLGRASQETALTLNKFPKAIRNFVSNLAQKMAIGDLSKYGIQKPNISPISQLSTTGKTPVIDLGTVAAIKAGRITVKKDIDCFTSSGVKFVDGSSEDYDSIILCTGYRSKLEAFIENIDAFLDDYGNPKACIGTDDWKDMYFLGFDNFKAGGILGVINDESAQIVQNIAA